MDLTEVFEKLVPYSAFAGEVMLAGADWSHNSGHSAKFFFSDTDLDANPMAEFTVRRGKRAGTRFHMILIEIQDDEEPVNQDQRKKLEQATDTEPTGKTGKRRQAGMLCRSPEFHGYLRSLGYIKDTHSESFRESIAKEFVLRVVGIKSRKELDTEPEAWIRYQNEVMRPFNRYLRANGI